MIITNVFCIVLTIIFLNRTNFSEMIKKLSLTESYFVSFFLMMIVLFTKKVNSIPGISLLWIARWTPNQKYVFLKNSRRLWNNKSEYLLSLYSCCIFSGYRLVSSYLVDILNILSLFRFFDPELSVLSSWNIAPKLLKSLFRPFQDNSLSFLWLISIFSENGYFSTEKLQNYALKTSKI